MISTLRRYLDTWAAKAFFFLLVLSFGIWGVADVIRNIGRGGPGDAAASVGDRKIEFAEASAAFRRQLAQITRQFGNIDPTPQIRQAVAAQTLETLVTQAAIEEQTRAMGIVTTDEDVKRNIQSDPNFAGPGGSYDYGILQRKLSTVGYTETGYVEQTRRALSTRQLFEAAMAGAAVPEIEARLVYRFQNEKRVADAVDFPFAAVPTPPAPSDDVLHRWYDNHMSDFMRPEERRINAIVLDPESVAKEITITDDDIKAAYEQQRSTFNKPETRTVRFVQAPDEATAQSLMAQWKGGADWAAVQKAADAAKGSAIELPHATAAQIPSPELAKAAFEAQPDAVVGPIKTALGWSVVQATDVQKGTSVTLEQARDQLRKQVLAYKSADLLIDHANKIEELLQSGTPLERVYADLGAIAVQGTLDAEGMTPDGKPAPIPGSDSLRAALIQAAFAAKKGDPARIIQAPAGPDGSQSFFAVEVDDVYPPEPMPFDQAKDRVLADWRRDAVRRVQDAAQAKLLDAVNHGQPIADAATAAGVQVRRLPAASRSAITEGVPNALIQPLFSMKQGEATVVETPAGFVVAQLASIVEADPVADPAGLGQITDALTRQLQQDVFGVLAGAIRDRARPQLNPQAIQVVAGTGGS